MKPVDWILLILVGCCVTAILFLVACAPLRPASPLVVPPEFERAEDVLVGTWTGRALTTFAAMIGPPPRVTGSIMMPMSTKACTSPLLSVLPYVTWVPREPRVGELVEVEWTTLALGAPRDWPAVVLCSKGGTSRIHASGIKVDGIEIGDLGTLFVDPGRAQWLHPGGEGAMLSRRPEDAGRIRLRWTPTPDQVGEVWYFHLLCFGLHPAIHPSGMLLSPGLRVEIGSARQ